MPSRLAAVVLNHRTPELTAGAVESLMASERRPEEIIVVDNGSGDHSAQLLSGLRGVTLLPLERNLGFSGGSNAGIQRALEGGAAKVVLVNSDARVLPGCLGTIERTFEGNIGIVAPLIVSDTAPEIIESAGILFWPELGVMRLVGAGKHRGSLEWRSRTFSGVTGCVMMVRREVFERIGLFADDYFYAFEDLDFCMRANAAGFLVACTAEASALHVGSATIGAESPRRLYFAARNHLLLAERARPMSRLPSLLRGGSIAALNVAHALLTSPAPRLSGLSAVARGIADHLRGRYGEGPDF